MMPLCGIKRVLGRFEWPLRWSSCSWVVGGAVGWEPGPGAAWPKSRCLGCEPAALATESFPCCLFGGLALGPLAVVVGAAVAVAVADLGDPGPVDDVVGPPVPPPPQPAALAAAGGHL